MPSIYIREWPTDAPHDLERQEGTLHAARLMVNSAITAPVIGGVPLIECNLVYGRQEMEKVARKIEELAYTNKREVWQNMFKTEAVMVRESDVILFIGCYRAAKSPLDAECGLCNGEPSCQRMYEGWPRANLGMIDVTDRRKETLIQGPLCTARIGDLGFAVGSALRMAVNLHVDCRPLLSASLAGLELEYCPESHFVIGMPMTAQAKNPYVDINPDYHLINMRSIMETIRETYVVTRQMVPTDYRHRVVKPKKEEE